jgi:hypothetical protein
LGQGLYTCSGLPEARRDPDADGSRSAMDLSSVDLPHLRQSGGRFETKRGPFV